MASATQIHDFNPGVRNFPVGLFWTIPVPSSSVQVHPGAGRASFHLDNFSMPDYGSIKNSLGSPNPKSNPGRISFDIEWTGASNRFTIGDGSTFIAKVIENTATIAWSATTEGVTYVSEPPNPRTNVFAEVGHEHNGSFLP